MPLVTGALREAPVTITHVSTTRPSSRGSSHGRLFLLGLGRGLITRCVVPHHRVVVLHHFLVAVFDGAIRTKAGGNLVVLSGHLFTLFLSRWWVGAVFRFLRNHSPRRPKERNTTGDERSACVRDTSDIVHGLLLPHVERSAG